MKPTEFANIHIGITANKVAAGETLLITAASGDIISATAVTPITTNTVAFQRIDRRYLAFDFTMSAITSRKKETRQTRPVPPPTVAGVYPFKGLVRFTDEVLYQGGDDNIVQLDTEISVDDLAAAKYYVLGFSNLGGKLQFVAIWRKENDLLVRSNELQAVVANWFLKSFAGTNRYLGPNFFGSNAAEYRRSFDETKYTTPTTWGTEYSILPFADNISPAPIPTASVVRAGVENVSSSVDGDIKYGDTSFIYNRDETFPLISSNYGQILVGTGIFRANLSINFTIDYYAESSEQFRDSVIGTSFGNSEEQRNWTVFLDKTDTATCSTSAISDSSGTLTIAYIHGQQNSTPFVGTKQASSTLTSNVTSLMLSGNDCYMFSTRTLSETYDVEATHYHDYDYLAIYQSPVRGDIENTYWPEYKEDYGSEWFLTQLSESYDSSGSIFIKVKNSRDNTIIECDPNSISIPVYNNNMFVLGQAIELECSGFATVGVDDNAFYDSIEKYTMNYQGRIARDDLLSGSISIDRTSDDTLHNAIFDGLLSRQYDIIWAENNKFYLGDLVITNADIEVIEQEEVPRYEVAGDPGNDPGLFNCVYVKTKFKHIKKVTCIITNKRRINASMWNKTNEAIIVSRDNYLAYLAVSENASDATGALPPRNINMYLLENPVIAISNSASAGEITNDRQMYAEILELLPSGRWVRREQAAGNVTAMPLGVPDTDASFWSYYRE